MDGCTEGCTVSKLLGFDGIVVGWRDGEDSGWTLGLVVGCLALMVEMTVLMTAPWWAVTTVVYSDNWLAD
jgi:uncharacterized membrane protein HdeD (DUF308 family)